MATSKPEHSPFDGLYDTETTANPTDDLESAVDSFLNLPDMTWLPSPSSGTRAGADVLVVETAAAVVTTEKNKSTGSKKLKKSKASNRATQKQLLAAIMEALAEANEEQDDDRESPLPSPQNKRARRTASDDLDASARMPFLTGSSSNESSEALSFEAPLSAILDNFLREMPQADAHPDTVAHIANTKARLGPESTAVDQLATPNDSDASCALRRCNSTSSVDSTAAEAAAAAAAALAAGSRKRKVAPDNEALSPFPTGATDAEMTREMRRALGAAILSGGPRPAAAPMPSVAHAPRAPLIATPAPASAAPRAQVDGPFCLRLPVATSAEQRIAGPTAPLSLSATLRPAIEEASAPCHDSSEDDVAGDDMVDEWMPRSRGRKEGLAQQGAGSRIKARSMAERQRRERISEGLQKLRLAVRGHGDTATMLDNAVAYVQQLQQRVSSLETSMLLHQASCNLPGVGGSLSGSEMFSSRISGDLFSAEY